MTSSTLTNPGISKGANIGIWVAQLLGAALFVMAGVMKLATPIPDLSAMMPWTGEYSETFVRLIGAVDLAGGIGLLLPSLTRIMPRLTVVAAFGCVVLQIFAIIFHVSRGEFMVLPMNVVYIALALIVLWGRARKAPITPRKA